MADFHSSHLLHVRNTNVQTSDNVIDDAAPEEAKWWTDIGGIKHKGFWVSPKVIKACQIMEEQFNPLPTDILLASFPKTGTTWLKALTISIVLNHKVLKLDGIASSNPLLNQNPHEIVPFLEFETFGENSIIDINQIPSPRVFNTHLAYSFILERIKKSGCKIVYISRNPWDTFVSLWHFYNMNYGIRTTMEVACDDFCKGLVLGGSYFQHVLEFWQVRNKNNILFLTYEELKRDPHKHVKELAEFLNFPLSSDQVDKIVANCSIERLKKVEENRDENVNTHWSGIKFDTFYRTGVVGDWKNHLSQEIAQKIYAIGKQKWDGTGLEFKFLSGSNYENKSLENMP